jgi:gentisate 1,2-dioxygenase
MTTLAIQQERDPLDAYYQELATADAGPLWTVLERIITHEPRPVAVPHLWKWQQIRPLVVKAGQLVDTKLAERRVVVLQNPGLGGQPYATETLYAGIQLILPGEIARSHRHTASAIRFIVEGSGAYTAVDGEKTIMQPGDFVTTPNWTWHDHGNESSEPMMWLDGLDVPMVNNLAAMFYEPYPEERQPITRAIDDSLHRYGVGLRPTWEQHLGPYSPLLNYTWKRARAALEQLSQAQGGSPCDDVILEYVNPYSGGPALPTLGANLQLLRPRSQTRAHRHTNSAVYYVAEGSGHSVVDGKRFDWEQGDVFAVPAWHWHEHASPTAAPAVLFSFTETPVLRALGLYREQIRE